MHLGNTTTNWVESTHWALKRLLQNSLGDLCSVWEAMNNMITLTYVVGHIFKVTLYKKLLGMVSRYALNQIAVEFQCVNYVGIDSSCCGCVMRTTHDLPYACELARHVVGSIPLDIIHIFSDKGLSEPEVTITKEMKTTSKLFEELDTKLRKIFYLDVNSMCPPLEKVKTKGAQKKHMTKHQRLTKRDLSYWEYVDALHSMQNSNSSVKRAASSSEQPKPKRNFLILDQFHPCIHDFIENIVNVKADVNCGYCAIAALLDMGEDSWSLVCNHLLKELAKWSDEHMNLLGGIDRHEELKRLLLVDGLSMVTMNK
ncbi:hypothetical protein GmHk_13G036048 [Glycine max]|nr:hypothetical protein GmHk_13G036048 [Glycine max]